MAITITGGKYASAALSSVGTTTVTVSTTPFVSGDFSAARRVDLYNAAGTTFKGMAFVRAYQSTSALQLETEFFDPKTGATVTQVVGDTILVSKNFADVVQSGIAINGNVVTCSDNITFGTDGVVNSCAFHDENLFVSITTNSFGQQHFKGAGGFASFGHLQNWNTKAWYGGCHFYSSATVRSTLFSASSASARMCVWGGSANSIGTEACYAGTGDNNAALGTDWEHFWCLQVVFNNIVVTSKGNGGNWTVGSNHVLEDCSYVGDSLYLILVRWGNGSLLGGQFKILRVSSAALSVSGSDSTGTFAFGAPAGSRLVVLDIGPNIFWRSNDPSVQTINCTNMVSTDYRAGHGINPESTPNTNATKNVYFKDSYSNLRDATTLATIRDSDWSVDDSGTASGSASAYSLNVFHSTGTGHSLGSARGPWTSRIRKYGYDEIETSIAEVIYPLGTAGTAFNVEFGGFVNQIARPSLTDSEATALAYAGITVTDHGASPVTWQSKSWSITVAVDLATYPARSAAEVFAHIKAGIAKTATWNGKAGLLWHVLMEEEGSGYISQRGISGGAGATNKGVRIIDQAGNALPGVTYMTADDGTTYTPPVAVVLTITANVSMVGAEIRIYDMDNTPAGSLGTELAGIENSGSATYAYNGSAGNTIWIQVMLDGYIEYGQSFVMPSASAGLSITLSPDYDA